ncbi:MAG: phosphatidylserine decarboxylase family protein [Thermodesulfovibrionales bacterium]|nr:phosphatidylserine decarboxylase family protein [Thermodesulfovibrionales bacterium]
MFKLAPEGYPFIGFFGVITIISYIAGGALTAFLPFVLTLFMAYFFRDPERQIPDGENIFVSPADGRVILIQNVREGQYLKCDALQVSIFMSPLNVHVNRAPCDGTVESVVHTPGRFLSAFKHEASLQNENIAMVMNTKHGKILVRQVAGFLARRAVCRVKLNDRLKKGERYGIIKFSSRLDVYLPKDADIKIRIGDKVKAGETVIGIIKRESLSGMTC